MQILLNLLDLLGVALIGALASLSIAGLQGESTGNRVASLLNMVGLSNRSLQFQAISLSIGGAFILILKTFLSIQTTRRTLLFLSRRSATISGTLIRGVLSKDITFLNKLSTQEFFTNITRGADNITIGNIGTSITILSDLALLLLMGLMLLYVDPLVSIMTTLMFGFFGFLMYKILNSKVQRIGRMVHEGNIEVGSKLFDVYFAFRDIFVRHRQEHYWKLIEGLRLKIARNNADLKFMPNVTKYLFESLLVIGTLIVTFVQLLSHNVQHAAASLGIYLAAASRIAPAILRVQQGLLQIRSNQATSESTLQLLSELREKGNFSSLEIKELNSFVPEIRLKNLSLTYPGSEFPALSDINLVIKSGDFVAIVGPSGAGKSSLADIILGVVQPTLGIASISNQKPQSVCASFPGKISYVPQDAFLINGTIRENLELGFEPETFGDKEMWHALELANLDNFVSNLEFGLETNVGENGANLSGGQKQRISIARALITKPKLLLLDEATSSLDAQVEADITSGLLKLKGQVTLVVIAHRLSTVVAADEVIYINNGKILATGTFEEVRTRIPDFNQQANLMGL